MFLFGEEDIIFYAFFCPLLKCYTCRILYRLSVCLEAELIYLRVRITDNYARYKIDTERSTVTESQTDRSLEGDAWKDGIEFDR